MLKVIFFIFIFYFISVYCVNKTVKLIDLDLSDQKKCDKAIERAQFAVNEIDSKGRLKLTSLLSAKVQNVTIIYQLEALVKDTKCRPTPQGGCESRCVFDISYTPWNDSNKLSSIRCVS